MRSSPCLRKRTCRAATEISLMVSDAYVHSRSDQMNTAASHSASSLLKCANELPANERRATLTITIMKDRAIVRIGEITRAASGTFDGRIGRCYLPFAWWETRQNRGQRRQNRSILTFRILRPEASVRARRKVQAGIAPMSRLQQSQHAPVVYRARTRIREEASRTRTACVVALADWRR